METMALSSKGPNQLNSHLSTTLSLPATFRPDDFLAFHQRDKQALSERVDASSFHKGLLWNEKPASLSVHFQSDQAEVNLNVDGEITADSSARLVIMVRRMLGLDQKIELFERDYREHPQLGALIASRRGLRVPVTTTPFEALTWAVTGQQISVGAAVSIRRKLIVATDLRHSSGLLCYPGAAQIARLTEDKLRQSGFSATKAGTLCRLAELVMSDQLSLKVEELNVNAEEIRTRLLAVRGIGPWTASYTLLRGFGWLDGSLHGDVAVRRGLQMVLGREEKIGEEEAKGWLAQFSPWRALVAAHLWGAKSSLAY